MSKNAKMRIIVFIVKAVGVIMVMSFSFVPLFFSNAGTVQVYATIADNDGNTTDCSGVNVTILNYASNAVSTSAATVTVSFVYFLKIT